jgi:hypothetical protein
MFAWVSAVFARAESEATAHPQGVA